MAKILETDDGYPDVKSIEVKFWDIDFFDKIGRASCRERV